MWKIYVGAVNWLGRIAGDWFGAALLVGWRCWLGARLLRAGYVAACVLLAVCPLMVTAQLSPQSVERTLQQHDARIRALERGQAEMISTLSRVSEQSAKIDRLTEQQATLANQINERDKFVAWLFGLVNTAALLIAGIWALMQLKRRHA